MAQPVESLREVPTDLNGSSSRMSDYAEDTTGFGAVALRTARDLLLRPREVLDAYLRHGSTGGGRYTRPLRFYVELNGVLMFYLFLAGGSEVMFGDFPPDLIDKLVAQSGKSRDAFMNDADGWFTLAMVPIGSAAYALAFAPLLKRWLRSGWRVAFRATFALLCAATLPLLAVGPFQYLADLRFVVFFAFIGVLLLTFVRMGRERWWTRRLEATGKGALLLLAFLFVMTLASFAMMAIALLGGLYAP